MRSREELIDETMRLYEDALKLDDDLAKMPGFSEKEKQEMQARRNETDRLAKIPRKKLAEMGRERFGDIRKPNPDLFEPLISAILRPRPAKLERVDGVPDEYQIFATGYKRVAGAAERAKKEGVSRERALEIAASVMRGGRTPVPGRGEPNFGKMMRPGEVGGLNSAQVADIVGRVYGDAPKSPALRPVDLHALRKAESDNLAAAQDGATNRMRHHHDYDAGLTQWTNRIDQSNARLDEINRRIEALERTNSDGAEVAGGLGFGNETPHTSAAQDARRAKFEGKGDPAAPATPQLREQLSDATRERIRIEEEHEEKYRRKVKRIPKEEMARLRAAEEREGALEQQLADRGEGDDLDWMGNRGKNDNATAENPAVALIDKYPESAARAAGSIDEAKRVLNDVREGKLPLSDFPKAKRILERVGGAAHSKGDIEGRQTIQNFIQSDYRDAKLSAKMNEDGYAVLGRGEGERFNLLDDPDTLGKRGGEDENKFLQTVGGVRAGFYEVEEMIDDGLRRVFGDEAVDEGLIGGSVKEEWEMEPGFSGTYDTADGRGVIEVAYFGGEGRPRRSYYDTISHESWHGARKMMTLQERRALAPYHKRWRKRYSIEEDYEGDYRKMSPRRRQDKLDEEGEAKAYGEYSANRRYGKPETWDSEFMRVADKLFGRLYENMMRLRNYLRGNGFRSAEDIFKAMDEGKIGSRMKSPDDVRGVSDPMLKLERRRRQGKVVTRQQVQGAVHPLVEQVLRGLRRNNFGIAVYGRKEGDKAMSGVDIGDGATYRYGAVELPGGLFSNAAEKTHYSLMAQGRYLRERIPRLDKALSRFKDPAKADKVWMEYLFDPANLRSLDRRLYRAIDRAVGFKRPVRRRIRHLQGELTRVASLDRMAVAQLKMRDPKAWKRTENAIRRTELATLGWGRAKVVGRQKALAQNVLGSFHPVIAHLSNNSTPAVRGAVRGWMRLGAPKWKITPEGNIEDSLHPTAKSIADALKPIDDKRLRKRFFDWWRGNDAAQRMEEGKERLFTDADIKALTDISDLPEATQKLFRDVLEDYQKNVNHPSLDLGAETGLYSWGAIGAWKKNMFHFPFVRQSESRGGKGKEKYGGTGFLEDPEAALEGRYAAMYSAMIANGNRLAIVRALRNRPGLLKERPQKEAQEAADEELAKIKDELKEIGEDEIDEVTEHVLLQRLNQSEGNSRLYVKDRGEFRVFEIGDEALAYGIGLVDSPGDLGPVISQFNHYRRFYEAMTRNAPDFAIRNSLLRDPVVLLSLAPPSRSKIKAPYRAVKAAVKGPYGAITGRTETAKMLAQRGVGGLTRTAEGQVPVNKMLTKRKMNPRYWVNQWQRGVNRLELIARTTLAERMKSEGYSNQEIAQRAQMITGFFGQEPGSKAARNVYSVFPFGKALVQGADSAGEMAWHNAGRAAAAIGLLGLADYALEAHNNENPLFREMSERDKALYYHFITDSKPWLPQPRDAAEAILQQRYTIVRVAKAFEVGAAANIVKASTGEVVDPESMAWKRQVAESLKATFGFSRWGVLTNPVAILKNENLYSGTPIVPGREEGLPTAFQTGRRQLTTDFARQLSEWGVDELPGGSHIRQWELVLDSGIGTLGNSAINYADWVYRAQTGRGLTKPGYSGGRPVLGVWGRPESYVPVLEAQIKVRELADKSYAVEGMIARLRERGDEARLEQLRRYISETSSPGVWFYFSGKDQMNDAFRALRTLKDVDPNVGEMRSLLTHLKPDERVRWNSADAKTIKGAWQEAKTEQVRLLEAQIRRAQKQIADYDIDEDALRNFREAVDASGGELRDAE